MIVVTDGVMPVDIEVQILKFGQLNWQQGVEVKLGVGKCVDRLIA